MSHPLAGQISCQREILYIRPDDMIQRPGSTLGVAGAGFYWTLHVKDKDLVSHDVEALSQQCLC